MPEPHHYDRLTQLDNSFLVLESSSPSAAMHVASTQIHEAAPLRRPDGALDIERIEEFVLSRLEHIPRYRQRLAYTPMEGHPVWHDIQSAGSAASDQYRLARVDTLIDGQFFDRLDHVFVGDRHHGIRGTLNRFAKFLG